LVFKEHRVFRVFWVHRVLLELRAFRELKVFKV